MKKDKETNSVASSQSPNRERVLVYVRIRPFNEQEQKTDPTTPIENIDLINNIMTGKKFFYIKNKKNSKKRI